MTEMIEELQRLYLKLMIWEYGAPFLVICVIGYIQIQKLVLCKREALQEQKRKRRLPTTILILLTVAAMALATGIGGEVKVLWELGKDKEMQQVLTGQGAFSERGFEGRRWVVKIDGEKYILYNELLIDGRPRHYYDADVGSKLNYDEYRFAYLKYSKVIFELNRI